LFWSMSLYCFSFYPPSFVFFYMVCSM
jgi:hypothetical protein